MKKELKCTFEERKSTKTDNTYKAIFIKLSDKYEKIVLLSAPEIALIESNINNNVDSNVFENFK